MKGQSGVLVTYTRGNEGGSNESICNSVVEALGKEGGKADNFLSGNSFLKNGEKSTLCNGSGGNSLKKKDTEGNEIYLGVYFENSASRGGCDLGKRDEVVAYVSERDSGRLTGSGGQIENWNGAGSCSLNGSNGGKKFLKGPREEFINLWLQSGKNIFFLGGAAASTLNSFIKREKPLSTEIFCNHFEITATYFTSLETLN
ncbi:hypothetical protein [Candidatus Mycoplasma haematominutum]|uniref:Uncharacterized protein n=1 Tax=Candidatus Mycoplasma haematominutum 'Birmingham 1' TaxID=1116213 RepID=G8C3K5_9MOLU|nr:hypothetical protein [Candidatus Mycoplasma haematominutum]CCE66903.1 hypothetical protein MHM_03850 [Candidatus Mycoplasma haematominutum 'Birmingham 1']